MVCHTRNTFPSGKQHFILYLLIYFFLYSPLMHSLKTQYFYGQKKAFLKRSRKIIPSFMLHNVFLMHYFQKRGLSCGLSYPVKKSLPATWMAIQTENTPQSCFIQWIHLQTKKKLFIPLPILPYLFLFIYVDLSNTLTRLIYTGCFQIPKRRLFPLVSHTLPHGP